MGAWGTGLYQDDVTCDVRNDYLNRLRIGYSNVEATKEVIKRNIDFIDDEEDGPLFWLALADTQWKYGRLLSEVKEQAIKCIEEGKDLKRWEENKSQYKKRKKVLEELKEKLSSPQPEEKKVKKLILHKAAWKVGDVLLYQIKNEKFRESKWYHKYVVFKVIGIAKTNIGSLPKEYSNEQNIVGLCNWVGDCIPNFDKIKKLDFIQRKNTFGKSVDVLCTFTFKEKDLKFLNFKLIIEDSTFKKNSQDIMDGTGIVWKNVNNLDWTIVPALDDAEKEGTLIDETIN